ncbi:hypothetical protein [Stieleria varia]|nr:hypothetical protein [Stieleria varia]
MSYHRRYRADFGKTFCWSFIAAALLLAAASSSPANAQWKRHTIDDRGRGADGVRLLDIDRDGELDIVTGWEESGHVCVYFAPDIEQRSQPWPRVVVGKQKSVEDAVAISLPGEFAALVVSCHEGNQKQVMVHRLDAKDDKVLTRDLMLQEGRWKSTPIKSCDQVSRWMFATMVNISGAVSGLVVGSKSPDGQVALLYPASGKITAESERIEDWNRVVLQKAGWIMSLIAVDMDADGDEDVLVSDRKGDRRGVYWLEQPESAKRSDPTAWTRHEIGAGNHEVMFIDGDAGEVLATTRDGLTLRFQRTAPDSWTTESLTNPLQIQSGKAVRRIPGSDPLQFVFAANTGVHKMDKGKPGVVLASVEALNDATNVSGPDGVKFDRIELLDVDEDGDLDVITCEERDNLGVFWYENPGQAY